MPRIRRNQPHDDVVRRPFSLVLAGLVASCSAGSGSYAEPIINKQADDPCDPGASPIHGGSIPPVDAGSIQVSLPGSSPGIGFDDIRFSATLSQLLVPGGRSGNFDFVDPSTEVARPIGGFSSTATYAGSDGFGATSADEGGGVVYVTDRTSKTLAVIDGIRGVVVATTTLASTPGYVRYVAPTHEVWVTEPVASQIEIFTLPPTDSTPPVSAGRVAVPAAESLAVDAKNALAFTNGDTNTYALDVHARSVVATWPNGCEVGRGLVVDVAHGWVMPACEGGLVSVLDEKSGKALGAITAGAGLDQLGYDAVALRLYVPSPALAAMSVVHVDSSSGVPSIIGSISVSPQSHCAVSAGARVVFVCAPATGQLLFVRDPF